MSDLLDKKYLLFGRKEKKGQRVETFYDLLVYKTSCPLKRTKTLFLLSIQKVLGKSRSKKSKVNLSVVKANSLYGGYLDGGMDNGNGQKAKRLKSNKK